MKRDFKQWETKIQVDDDRRHMLVETAWEMLYVKGIQPNTKAISDLLASRSLTPTRVSYLVFLNFCSHFNLYYIQNTFSEHLAKYGFEFHSMFVVDLMHKFELGVWKATFTDLLRILYAQGGNRIQELNKRYSIEISVLSIILLTYCIGTKKSPPLAVT